MGQFSQDHAYMIWFSLSFCFDTSGLILYVMRVSLYPRNLKFLETGNFFHTSILCDKTFTTSFTPFLVWCWKYMYQFLHFDWEHHLWCTQCKKYTIRTLLIFLQVIYYTHTLSWYKLHFSKFINLGGFMLASLMNVINVNIHDFLN